MNAVVKYLFPYAVKIDREYPPMIEFIEEYKQFTAENVRDLMNDEPYFVEESTSLF